MAFGEKKAETQAEQDEAKRAKAAIAQARAERALEEARRTSMAKAQAAADKTGQAHVRATS